MNQKDRDKLLLRIGDARLAINIKENLTPMDCKIDNVLKDCATILQNCEIYTLEK